MIKTAVITLIAGCLVVLCGGLLFIISGIYNLAADEPHLALIRWALQTTRTRSIKFHARGIRTPNLRDRALLRNGFGLYRKNCQPCHGAPGVAGEQIGRGINPKPPELVTAGTHWSDSELYWITSHGLKMSGMPAFAPQLTDSDRWSIVGFLRRLSRISPADYQLLIAAVDHGTDPVNWGMDDNQGFAQLRTGKPEIGRQLLIQYGCVTCHTVPQIGWGQVGPPLTGFSERAYIAGFLVNVPTNTIKWIIDPKRYKPKTAMPTLQVNPRDALNIAAYLYKLGSPKRIRALQATTARR